MNNNLRLHELGRSLCECKYIKKGNTAKTALIHNAIKFLLMVNRLDQSEVPRIELCIKKARICTISELFCYVRFRDYLLSQNNLFAVVMPVGIFALLYKRSLSGYKNLRGVGPTAFAGAANVGIPVRLQSENVSG